MCYRNALRKAIYIALIWLICLLIFVLIDRYVIEISNYQISTSILAGILFSLTFGILFPSQQDSNKNIEWQEIEGYHEEEDFEDEEGDWYESEEQEENEQKQP